MALQYVARSARKDTKTLRRSRIAMPRSATRQAESANMRPNAEALHVIRRRIQLCLLALSILGLAPVALACETATPLHDCCPTGPHTPCDTGGSMPSMAMDLPSCCATTPAPLSTAVSVLSTERRGQFLSDGSSEHSLKPVLPIPIAVSPELARLEAAGLSDRVREPQPLYLLTRRLRL